MMTKCVSPWYNCAGWLGVKCQFTYLLVCAVSQYHNQGAVSAAWERWHSSTLGLHERAGTGGAGAEAGRCSHGRGVQQCQQQVSAQHGQCGNYIHQAYTEQVTVGCLPCVSLVFLPLTPQHGLLLHTKQCYCSSHYIVLSLRMRCSLQTLCIIHFDCCEH